MARDLFEHGSYIAHVVKGLQLLDSQPFLLLTKLHSLQECQPGGLFGGHRDSP